MDGFTIEEQQEEKPTGEEIPDHIISREPPVLCFREVNPRIHYLYQHKILHEQLNELSAPIIDSHATFDTSVIKIIEQVHLGKR